MTLRDDVRATLAGTAGEPDAPAATPELADLPPDLVGAVIGHFADTASIADADALAPIAMATGPVPFDPELDHVEPITDPFDAIGQVDIDPAALDDRTDLGDRTDHEFTDDGGTDGDGIDDPSDFDVADHSDVAEATSADGTDGDFDRSGAFDPADADESFGMGAGADASSEPFEAEDAMPDAGPDDVDEFSFVPAEDFDAVEEIVNEPMADFDPVDLDLDDLDDLDDLADGDPTSDDLDLVD